MIGEALKATRLAAQLTQSEAAQKLGITQAYLSMAERGKRPVTAALAARLTNGLGVTPTAVPLELYSHTPRTSAWFKDQLGALGYHGFSYLRGPVEVNPARLMMDAIDTDDLDARITEALPWIPVAFPQLDWNWLIVNAKSYDRQNRLGFLVELASEVALQRGDTATAQQLSKTVQSLERARLLLEDSFRSNGITKAEVRWLREHRPKRAAHWNLLSDLTLEDLTHAIDLPPAGALELVPHRTGISR